MWKNIITRATAKNLIVLVTAQGRFIYGEYARQLCELWQAPVLDKLSRIPAKYQTLFAEALQGHGRRQRRLPQNRFPAHQLKTKREGRMNTELKNLLEEYPIIIAVKSDDDLSACLSCDKKVVFVLYGSVITIPAIVARLKEADKAVFVDIDLLDGLSAREAAVDYLARSTAADGIVSTKAPLVRRAAALGLATVYRTFYWTAWPCAACRKRPRKAGGLCGDPAGGHAKAHRPACRGAGKAADRQRPSGRQRGRNRRPLGGRRRHFQHRPRRVGAVSA